ncbi:hypothetical protein [Streptomyces albogriseolus]|uniref:hypothetical protein n=1 Tax=Streptomyces albogriseolus TaxID=1887 RepID=UPI0037F2251B
MPFPALPERATRAGLAKHFSPAYLAAAVAEFSAEEVRERRVRNDNSGRLSRAVLVPDPARAPALPCPALPCPDTPYHPHARPLRARATHRRSTG